MNVMSVSAQQSLPLHLFLNLFSLIGLRCHSSIEKHHMLIDDFQENSYVIISNLILLRNVTTVSFPGFCLRLSAVVISATSKGEDDVKNRPCMEDGVKSSCAAVGTLNILDRTTATMKIGLLRSFLLIFR